MIPRAGEGLNDFELLRELGKGSSGQVFLARQVSLQRLVALKVSVEQGSEARTLARLEHSHIVQIFSETTDLQSGLHLLCMQYIAGMTLGQLMRALRDRPPFQRDGCAVLEVLDSHEAGPLAFDPAGLRERETLRNCDWVEVGCRLGARLAEALAHAHGLGVLHRDVKPANVLLNLYGRPFLADFNMAAFAWRAGGEQQPLGGTLLYMAPEHLAAFLAREASSWAGVDERADLYSLGLVLFEWFAGRSPPTAASFSAPVPEIARLLLQERGSGPPVLPEEVALPRPVTHVLGRCLAASPRERHGSAAELARALWGCAAQRRAETALPPPGPLTRALQRHPFLLGALLLLLPHFLGSALNIVYNSLEIVGRLTPTQQVAFRELVLGYNSFAYPLCITILIVLMVPVHRAWPRAGAGASSANLPRLRRHTLWLPFWCVLFSCLGWLPGGLLFPFLLDQQSEGVASEVYAHFAISFTLSGLIALTYSYLAVQYLVTRIYYPVLWSDPSDFSERAQGELAHTRTWIVCFQVLAVLIPLTGAVLLLGISPQAPDPATDRTFRLLVTGMIILGMLGLGVALEVSRRLNQTLDALCSVHQPE